MFLRDDVYVVRGTAPSEDGSGVTHDLSWPGQEGEGVDAPEATIYGLPGIVCRPAPPDDDGQCEAIAVDNGGDTAIVAMRDTRALAVAGALDPGDYCYLSPQGRCGLWCKGDGTLSLRKDGVGGSTDAFVQIESDGTLRLGNQWGGIEIGPGGAKVHFGSTILELGDGYAQITASEINLTGGAIGLGAAPSMPLAVTTPGPQIAATALPATSIKITIG